MNAYAHMHAFSGQQLSPGLQGVLYFPPNQNITPKRTRVYGAFRWHAAGAQPRWDMGNYYTVGGSGRVIPKDPVSVSQIGYGHFCDCAW